MTKLSDIIKGFVTSGEGSVKEAVSSIKGKKIPFGVSEANGNQSTVTSKATEFVASSKDEMATDEIDENGIIITDEFKEGFSVIDGSSPFTFITGRAGTGKSTFIELIKKRLKSFAILAPTGVAALNVGGQTIHSFFKFRPGPIDLRKIGPARSKEAYQALNALIIDEISMVRADLLDAIDAFLKVNGPIKGAPFGGVKIIAVGDLFQLPPIVSNEEEKAFLDEGYDSPFFFSAKCLKQTEIRKIEFNRIFRQSEAQFIEILNSIREGKNLERVLGLLNGRVGSVQKDKCNGMILTATNKVASDINLRRLIEIQAEEKIFNGKVTGEIRVDKDKLPAPMELILKVGAQVMFVKNNGLEWVNGTVGTVTALDNNAVTVRIRNKFGVDKDVKVDPVEWENFKYEYNQEAGVVEGVKVGSYKQIPLMLAWAVTIHKSQGKTFDEAHIDLGWGAFSEGQVYVALSRCRTFEGITLEKAVRESDVRVSREVLEFAQ